MHPHEYGVLETLQRLVNHYGRAEFGPSCPGQKGTARALDVGGARAYVSPIAAARGDAGAWMWSWGPYAGRGATPDAAVAAFWTFYDTHTAAQAAKDAAP